MAQNCHILPPEQEFVAPTGTIHLRVLQTTDVHAHIMPFDYLNARPARGGLAAAAARIKDLKAEVPGALLFDCGDFLQGTAMGDLPGQVGHTQVPVIDAMNALGYDGATLGNHDFSFGYAYLRRAIQQANFPFTATNLYLPPQAALQLPTYLMLNRALPVQGTDDSVTLNIGVIGVAPPTTAQWEAVNVEAPMALSDIVESARGAAEALRDQGADVVIALCHSGIMPADRVDPDNAATPLAAIDGIDVVLAGHIHGLFPSEGFLSQGPVDGRNGTLHGTPTVMAGAFGSHVGIVDLALTQGPDGTWRPTKAQARLTPAGTEIARTPKSVRKMDRLIRGIAESPIGLLKRPLHSFFTLLGPDAVGQVTGAAMITGARDALGGDPDLPVIAVTPPFRYGWTGPRNFVDIPAGVMSARYSGLLYPYPNRLAVVRATGALLRLWLEQAVAQYAHIQPGDQDVPLLCGPGYALDMGYGISYGVDLSHPAWPRDARPEWGVSGRISNMSIGGNPIGPEDELYVASSTFRAMGVPPISAPAMAHRVVAKGEMIRTLLMAEIAEGRGTPEPTEKVRFGPIAGASAIFDTAPKAEHLIAEHPMAEKLEALGPGGKGLLQVRVHLGSRG